ncbi:uncharacterized protein si:ch211-269k10.4 [Corythoichthys intestinalis]|uniref:uncharacterized protein si:ch211-269k10.4 n=1 Tax=Corythoichthys intestinalis TaxID=161448 RepID=UPI0025A4EC54|nr:uncharacterized protein si:ch211-269k10.4 [Corythoichthys intestinalis]XP_057689825.1 uncharacterized protein si:ch211-269k10.4 [Corythoichthys intestinalis]
MACSDVKLEIQDEQDLCRDIDKCPQVVRYQVTRFLKDERHAVPDHIHIAVLGSLQVVGGLLSVGIGLTFAVNLAMDQLLVMLFRVSHFTGILFIVAGVVSFMLVRYPGLLPVSLVINRGCIVIGLVAVSLTVVDFSQGKYKDDQNFKIHVLELCMLGLQLILTVTLSVILCLDRKVSH